uniref:ShTK domain protein n=1 Tax=Caenorhabditis tropicalis TaxID=1561998 RepID=A0A1I7UIU2_9PELO
MFVLLIASFVALAAGQTCDPTKITAPCDATLPCATGSTCDLTLGSCCLDADLVTTTIPAGASTVTSSSSTISGGVTVTSRTSSSTGCVDRVNPATGTSDCAARAALCNDSVYYDVMTQQCPRTCGRCSSSSSSTTRSGSCVDLTNPRTGTSDCSSMAAYCNDSNYIALMRVQCPRTCGFSCVDRVNPSTGRSDCASNIALCNNSAYQTVMRAQCPRTCGFC